MKRIPGPFNILTLIALALLLAGFAGGKNRKFEFRFHMHDIQSFAPSCQMAIWLEKPDSSYVKTLYLSEYLSYGGYNEKEICHEWSVKANWSEVTKAEFDAATGATPSIGDVQLKVQCPVALLPEGEYLMFIEIHLVEDYNELYYCVVDISGKKSVTDFTVKYIPQRYAKKTEGDLLTGVQVISK